MGYIKTLLELQELFKHTVLYSRIPCKALQSYIYTEKSAISQSQKWQNNSIPYGWLKVSKDGYET